MAVITSQDGALVGAQENIQQRVAQALTNLDAWLQTMRQPGGFGGPVAHWWRHSLLYAGPGLDWRYEGILCGYAELYRKTGREVWLHRVREAAGDLLDGQRVGGGLMASEFEINPGTLGTPHEAAAVLGLLDSVDCLTPGERGRVLGLCEAVLDHLIAELWDEELRGFNDRPGIRGRVPNKLATLGEALLRFVLVTGEQRYLVYARACLDDVVHYQAAGAGGAIHQYAPDADLGDGRFFPYYNARCIPGLLAGADAFSDERYAFTAARAAAFIRGTLAENRWPQIVYAGGKDVRWPSWVAGSADILRALHLVGDDVLEHGAMERLLRSQLPGGGFPTAEGFALRDRGRASGKTADWLDILPVCGWNDKALRLLAALLSADAPVCAVTGKTAEIEVQFYGMAAIFHEDRDALSVRVKERTVVHWRKDEPWLETQFRPPAL